MSDMMNPPMSLLCKLASIAVHADEYLSDEGHEFDRDAIDALMADAEVKEWLEQMAAASLVPRKRNA